MPELNKDITPDPEDTTPEAPEAPEAEDIEVVAHSEEEELPCGAMCGSFSAD